MSYFYDLFPAREQALWIAGSGLAYYALYHASHYMLARGEVRQKLVGKAMSQARFQQQVRNISIVPFLLSAVFGSFLSWRSGEGVGMLTYMGVISGCYTFELIELFWNQRYTLAVHHIVAVFLYLCVWLYAEIPDWVSLSKLSLFLGSTFIADVAHHFSGVLIHFVGREKKLVRWYLTFAACVYAGRMAVGVYCGIYALLFLKGVFGAVLTTVAAFCLVIDRFVWFPKILVAYGLREEAAPAPEKPTFVLPNKAVAAGSPERAQPHQKVE